MGEVFGLEDEDEGHDGEEEGDDGGYGEEFLHLIIIIMRNKLTSTNSIIYFKKI